MGVHLIGEIFGRGGGCEIVENNLREERRLARGNEESGGVLVRVDRVGEELAEGEAAGSRVTGQGGEKARTTAYPLIGSEEFMPQG